MRRSSEGGEVSREWFRDWFGEEYLALYPHRNAREATRAVRLFLEAVPPPEGGTVLDVGCGAGRHLRELLACGVPAVGLDLSRVLLGRARQRCPRARLVRGDMRFLPFRDGAFSGLTSFFTSFGYFASREEDARVVTEMRRVLQRGGPFLLDFLNADRVRQDLVARDERRVGTTRVTQTREIQGDTVVKTIRLSDEDGAGEGERTFHERVRLYPPADLEALLAAHGMRTEDRFGSYGGEPFDGRSHRLILAGRAA
ncbi:MAG: methyltransferase domain-containing protein [Gemmatimonadota bacterium]|nr:methyltransferase domain-containing protein [Gemmatimonadota bacterium]